MDKRSHKTSHKLHQEHKRNPLISHSKAKSTRGDQAHGQNHKHGCSLITNYRDLFKWHLRSRKSMIIISIKIVLHLEKDSVILFSPCSINTRISSPIRYAIFTLEKNILHECSQEFTEKFSHAIILISHSFHFFCT